MSDRHRATRVMLTVAALFLPAAAARPALAQATGPLLGVETVAGDLPFFEARTARVRNARPDDEFPPLRVLLSRERYWAEDGHLDVLVQLAGPADARPAGALRVRLADGAGRELSRFELDPLPGPQFIFYPALPPALYAGGAGEISLAWVAGGETLAETSRPFRVEVTPDAAPRAGRIPLRVANGAGVTGRGVPVTVGVPFPRGALGDEAHLRLVDEAGAEIPLQVRETARWSKFGSVKWVHCDFTVDLAGGPRDLFLEYGPAVARAARPDIAVAWAPGFPRVEAGRLRFDRGLWFDAAGDGSFVPVLGEEALAGAFVEHEDGRVYRAPAEDVFELEEAGPEKVVLRRAGWYREAGGTREFCRYVTRWVIHRDSPLVRVFHTWIFTGDGNHDRIRDMGWRFDLPLNYENRGFLASSGEDGAWLEGDYLLQHDYSQFALADGAGMREFPGGRAPGVASAAGPGARFYFGARDFWQNYPSELEFRDGAFWFHNWPRHGRPTRHTYDHEALSPAEFRLNTVQLRFAHAGETLDFRLPEAYTDGPIWEQATTSGNAAHWDRYEPESANAQGISRTEEFWLYFTPPDTDPAGAQRLLAGLNEETLGAFADPAWVAASGAFHRMHPRDPENFPEEEAMFELFALGPGLWRERLGVYGKWIYGDLPSWNLALESQTPSFYRAYMGTHHGWPYSWVPYARSGDGRLRKLADTWTRQMVDVTYCHHADEAVDLRIGENRHRRRGWLGVSLIPWARYRNSQTRDILTKCDYLFHAWYLTGYHRALDTLRDWSEQVKIEEVLSERGSIGSGRGSVAVLRSFLETWEDTFDPWFLAAAHAVADMHIERWRAGAWTGHFFRTGDRDFHVFTGSEAFKPYYLAYADAWGGHREPNSWMRMGEPWSESNAYAWELTGNDYYLGRTAYFVDSLKSAVYTAEEPWYLRGYYTRVGSVASYTGWALEYFPTALATLTAAGRHPAPLVANTTQLEPAATGQVIVLRKEANRPLSLRLAAEIVRADRNAGQTARYRVTGPGGGEVLAGEWAMEKPVGLEVPAGASSGEYQLALEFRGRRALEFPVSPPGTPEVLLAGPGQAVATGGFETQYYFMVPPGTAGFSVEFPLPGQAGGASRTTIRGPDGETAWDLNWHPSHADGTERTVRRRAEIPVAPGQAGRLWRLTLPGHGRSFLMDPLVPPVYATEPDRWFLPADLEADTGR